MVPKFLILGMFSKICSIRVIYIGYIYLGFGESGGIKTQILDIIRSVRTVMRIPLIFINVLVITKAYIAYLYIIHFTIH